MRHNIEHNTAFKRMDGGVERDKNRMKESLTVSVLRVCQFTSLVVFLRRLLISAECRLQFYCQHWWKEERERERENCRAAKKEEFVIGREWFQMLEQSMEPPGVPASWPMCLLWAPLAAESDTPVPWATADKTSRCEKLQCLDWEGGSLLWFQVCITSLVIPFLPLTSVVQRLLTYRPHWLWMPTCV